MNTDKFEGMGLKDEILRGISSYGWELPSNIQQKGIPAIVSKRDVIVQAQSGLGKTGTFSIGMLQRVEEGQGTIQGVIILNTRELADQVYNVIRSIGTWINVNFVKCVGGTMVNRRLTYPDGPTILIGTPGKINDTLGKISHERILQPLDIKVLIIDEFDKTLEDDFIPTIREIFRYIGTGTNVVLSSATVNDMVLEVSEKFMRDPIIISVKNEELSLEGIRHFYVDCTKDEWKFDTIIDIYRSVVVAQSIIFVNSKNKCDYLEKKFTDNDFTIKSLHGGMEQRDRDQIMSEFRQGKIRILISTDLTARGIDVPSINLVINYDMPKENAQYIHRVGRAGRYGKKGFAINLIGGKNEQTQLKSIEEHYRTIIQELPTNFASFMK